MLLRRLFSGSQTVRTWASKLLDAGLINMERVIYTPPVGPLEDWKTIHAGGTYEHCFLCVAASTWLRTQGFEQVTREARIQYYGRADVAAHDTTYIHGLGPRPKTYTKPLAIVECGRTEIEKLLRALTLGTSLTVFPKHNIAASGTAYRFTLCGEH